MVLMLGPLDWESIPLQTCERQAGKNLSFIVMDCNQSLRFPYFLSEGGKLRGKCCSHSWSKPRWGFLLGSRKLLLCHGSAGVSDPFSQSIIDAARSQLSHASPFPMLQLALAVVYSPLATSISPLAQHLLPLREKNILHRYSAGSTYARSSSYTSSTGTSACIIQLIPLYGTTLFLVIVRYRRYSF